MTIDELISFNLFFSLSLSFVSRMNVRATDKHAILGMQQFKPHEFGGQIALNMENAWGIVRCIIDFLNKQKDGKFIIMKDPNKVSKYKRALYN